MDYNVYSNEELAAAANSGNAEAKVQLGRRFLLGVNGTESDPYTAKKWFEDAYACGSIAATRYLGIMYLGEDGIVADLPKAISLLTTASNAGDGAATFHLASAYMNGTGVEENPLKAIELFQKAADSNYLHAQYFMAEIARQGQLGEKDYIGAMRYLEAAISHTADEDLTDNDKSVIGMACDTLGDMYKNGEGVPENLEKAAEIYTKGAEMGNAWAQFEIGMMYQKGEGVEQNKEQSLYWLQMSAMGGNQSAITLLGAMCALGEGGSQQDVVAARSYLKMAADGGSVIAQSLLGSVLLKDGNIEEGLSFLKAAADKDDATALYNLAHYYIFTADDTDENIAMGAKYAEKAVATGEKPDAKCLVASLYLKGKYYPRDHKKALELIREAKDEGSELASSEEFRNAMAAISDLKIKTSREDFMRIEDMAQDIEYIRTMIYDENGESHNLDANPLIKNALTFEKLGNNEKLLECYTSITNTYPNDLRGWLGLLLIKSNNFSLYFAPANIERYYEERQLMEYALRLTDDETVKHKLGEIFVKYEDNLGAIINSTYMQLATELKEGGHILNDERFEQLEKKYGLIDKYPDDLVAKYPELRQRIPIMTEGLYGLMNYVFYLGIGIKLFSHKMIAITNQKEQEQKEILKRNTRQSLIQNGNTMTDRLFDESFERTYPSTEVYKQFEEIRKTLRNSAGDVSPSKDNESTTCASELLKYAGTDDEFIEMLMFICRRNGLRGYDFLETYLSAKAKAEKAEAAQKKAEEKRARADAKAKKVADQQAVAVSESSSFDPADKPKSKWLTALSYISILFLVPAFMDKESNFTKHHVNQGGTLFLISLIKTVLFDWIIGGLLFGIVSWIIGLGCFAFAILGIYRVFTDSKEELPLIGKLRIVEKILEKFQ